MYVFCLSGPSGLLLSSTAVLYHVNSYSCKMPIEQYTETPKLVTLSKFVFQLILFPIFPVLKLMYTILRNLACVADVIFNPGQ